MQQIDISEAKIRLPALLDAAIQGAEIIITLNGHPLVKIARIEAVNPDRAPGALQGSIGFPDDFNDSSAAETVSEIDVMAAAGDLLNDHLPDRFCAGAPQFDRENSVWQVPVLLSYPIIGTLGQVGEIAVSAKADQVLSFTPIEEMKAAAWALIEQNREKLEAPVP